ncbi:hypothetical protein CYJ73_15455 [Gordonia terrae]|uniref:Uncharacterized protein n=1 Tax=Gordonia terrae TaxID=2055 RepID=A0A2I1R625_9ACTN|nr:hypothetical protein [Gordonia terrae]PKZ64558.1 hypothetical protein CYJ73_15455 [Gordonia terrae]UPW10098.1 hypothetical protein M1C59_04380 [Gordonia terrae]
MYIVVTPPEEPAVREPEDLKRLSIVASSSLRMDEVAANLAAFGLAHGSAEPDHVLVDAGALRALAGDALNNEPTVEWHRGFDAMLAYAESKGWYRTETEIVQVHIDWSA